MGSEQLVPRCVWGGPTVFLSRWGYLPASQRGDSPTKQSQSFWSMPIYKDCCLF